MGQFLSLPARLIGRARNAMLAFAVSTMVIAYTATPANAEVQSMATIDDCTVPNVFTKFFKFVGYTVFNFADAWKWWFIGVGLLVGALGAIFGRGHKGWQIAAYGLAIVLIVAVVVDANLLKPTTCVPKVTL